MCNEPRGGGLPSRRDNNFTPEKKDLYSRIAYIYKVGLKNVVFLNTN